MIMIIQVYSIDFQKLRYIDYKTFNIFYIFLNKRTFT